MNSFMKLCGLNYKFKSLTSYPWSSESLSKERNFFFFIILINNNF